MTILKKSFIILLSFIVLAVSFSGCNNPDDNGGKKPPVEATTYDLILDGASDYKIVTADDPRGYEAYAGQELVKYFNEASSIELLTVTESEVTVNDTSKLIILGETEAAKAAKVEADILEFGARGFVVKQIESNVYIVGGDTMGTLYGVYEFLHYQFGFEPYAEDEIALEKGVRNKKLMELDLVEIPDIAHIQSSHGFWARANEGHLLRYNHFNEVFVNATGQPWHNSLEYASPNAIAECDCHKDQGIYYKDAHPAWYVESLMTYHYTAHGDPEELKIFEDVIFNKIIFFVERDFARGKYYTQIGFMAEDYTNIFAQDDKYTRYSQEKNDELNAGWTKENDSVYKLRQKYREAYAAAMLIQFINPLQERVTQYMNENHNGRKMSITVFAYLDTQQPPVKSDANGNYVPIDDDVILHKDANVLMAPIWGDYIHDYEDTATKALIEGWKACSSNISVWYYDYYFSTTSVVYLDSTYSLQSYFLAAYDAKATWLFFEGNIGNDDYAVFKNLRAYLISKLGWDVHADVHELVDAYFTNYYKDAAPYMKQYFDELTAYCAYLKETTNLSGVTGSTGANDASYWKKGVVLGWIDILDKAFEAIEPLKDSDATLYNKLYVRILTESLSPRYILLQHYANDAFTDESFVEELTQFKADAKLTGFTRAVHINFQDFAPVRA